MMQEVTIKQNLKLHSTRRLLLNWLRRTQKTYVVMWTSKQSYGFNNYVYDADIHGKDVVP
jgi:hypothetical protein